MVGKANMSVKRQKQQKVMEKKELEDAK